MTNCIIVLPTKPVLFETRLSDHHLDCEDTWWSSQPNQGDRICPSYRHDINKPNTDLKCHCRGYEHLNKTEGIARDTKYKEEDL